MSFYDGIGGKGPSRLDSIYWTLMVGVWIIGVVVVPVLVLVALVVSAVD